MGHSNPSAKRSQSTEPCLCCRLPRKDRPFVRCSSLTSRPQLKGTLLGYSQLEQHESGETLKRSIHNQLATGVEEQDAVGRGGRVSILMEKLYAACTSEAD